MKQLPKSSDRFSQGLMAYLTANTGWQDLRRIIEEYPEILDRKADRAIRSMIRKNPEEQEIVKILEQRRDFLKRCRETGVERTFQQFLLEVRPDAPPELRSILDTLCRMSPFARSARHAQMYQRALELLDRNTNKYIWGILQYELGFHLSYTPEGNQSRNSELAIESFMQSLEVRTPEDTPVEWAQSWRQLGRAYIHRVYGAKRENMELAISAYRRALEVFNHELHPEEWGGTLTDLAHAFIERETGEPAENVELALHYLHQVLERVTKEECPTEWAMAQMNLAFALMQRHRGERDTNYEQAIVACNCALEIRTASALPADRAMTLRILAQAYGERLQGDPAENIEYAIRALEEARSLYIQQDNLDEVAVTSCDIAKLHQIRIRGNRSKNIEESIRIYEAVQKDKFSILEQPIKWASSANGLAAAFLIRMHGDREENLERGVVLLEQAISIYDGQAMREDAAVTRINLANIYRNRLRGDKDDNLKHAISLIERALQEVRPNEMPNEWAFGRLALASVYSNLAQDGPNEHTPRIVTLLQEALSIYSRDAWPREWTQTTSNLAAALCQDSGSSKAENVERAITLLQEVVGFVSREGDPVTWATAMHRLGIAHYGRVLGERTVNLEQSAQCWKLALEELDENSDLDRFGQAANDLGLVYMEQQRWEDAAHYLQLAIRASDIRYQSSLLRAGKDGPLARIGKSSRAAGYALARAGRLREAVVMLELGRARSLSEAMTRERINLPEVAHHNLRYQSISMRISQLEAEEREASLLSRDRDQSNRTSRIRSHMRQAHEELDGIINLIRKIPGYEKFLEAPTWDDCAGAATDHAPASCPPLVYLVTIEQGSLALLLHPARDPAHVRVESLWLDNFNGDGLITALVQQEQDGTYKGFMASVLDEDSKELAGALNEILPVLGKNLIAPIATRLRELGSDSVVLIPCGHLNLLPLHAAQYRLGSQDSCLLNEVAVSYSPSARALVAARAGMSGYKGSPKLGGVAVGHAPSHPRYLPYARIELEEIAQHFSPDSYAALCEHQATKADVLALLPQVNHVHFSCHGSFDAAEPLDSALELASEPLTLHEILAQGSLSEVRLVVLSACQTAVIEFARLPEEVISWPSAFLQAGAAAVVGTLWPVNSVSTALLMVKFYELYLKGDQPTGEGPMKPARALCKAQQWLRSLSEAEANLMIGSAAFTGEPYPFSAPQYWAPFVFVGA